MIDTELDIDLTPYTHIAGLDEAGRGPLVGPVVAAAVILNPDDGIEGLKDSKRLTEARREALAVEIRTRALAWSVVSVDAEEIDRINILQASLLAMKRAAESLALQPDIALVDGNQCPDMACRVEAIVRGDSRVGAIAAASILAKVDRDRQMRQLHERFPDYGFDQHKGYATRLHMERLVTFGPCPFHRKSFAPVRKALENIDL